jgi:transcriptional regulator with XRE-family HTH domain
MTRACVPETHEGAGRPEHRAGRSNVRRLREKPGMSQSELARRAGLDLRTVTRVENVEREPGVATIARLARG